MYDAMPDRINGQIRPIGLQPGLHPLQRGTMIRKRTFLIDHDPTLRIRDPKTPVGKADPFTDAGKDSRSFLSRLINSGFQAG